MLKEIAVIVNFESGSKTNIQMSIQRSYNVSTITSVNCICDYFDF